MRLFFDKTWNHTILIVDLEESKISLEGFSKEAKDNPILFFFSIPDF